jgi:hypothetical protein
VSVAAITLCIASQRVLIVVVVYFVIDSVRKLLDIPSYTKKLWVSSMGVRSGFLLSGKNTNCKFFVTKNIFGPSRDEETEQFRILHKERSFSIVATTAV